MPRSVFKVTKQSSPQERQTALREFGGGLNLNDNELVLKSEYSVDLVNMLVQRDGTLGIRGGTRLFADLSGVIGGDIIAFIRYFKERIVVVTLQGNIALVDGTGAIELLSLDPAWGVAANEVNGAVFDNRLILVNGASKPIVVDPDNNPKVYYLVDEGTGVNTNVPICRYVVSMNKFLVMAGDPLQPDRVHISSSGTSGTWVGDADPNNAVYRDMSQVINVDDPTVLGLSRFREQLVVGLRDGLVLGILGNITADDDHEPDFNDTITSYGVVSHKTMIALHNDLLMLDGSGVPSLTRTKSSGDIDPQYVSELIEPDIIKTTGKQLNNYLESRNFALYNKIDKQYMLCMPNAESGAKLDLVNDGVYTAEPFYVTVTTVSNHNLAVGEEITFDGLSGEPAYLINSLNSGTWTVYGVLDSKTISIFLDTFSILPGDLDQNVGGNNGTLGYRFDKLIVYTLDTRQYQRARSWSRMYLPQFRCGCRTQLDNMFFADSNKLWQYATDRQQYRGDLLASPDAKDIPFIWEIPWGDFNRRGSVKHVHAIQLEIEGDAEFTLEGYTDRIYKDSLGRPQPAASLTFQGTFPTRVINERYYPFNLTGKIIKLRVHGMTRGEFKIVSLILYYKLGGTLR